jgi:hypothetical protein
MREAASAVVLFASAASPNFAPAATAATVPASARSAPAPVGKSAADAPVEPAADLIEFIGEWTDDKGDTVDPAALTAAPPASPPGVNKPAAAAEPVIEEPVIDGHD